MAKKTNQQIREALYKLGDVTEAFKEGRERTGKVLNALDIKIICHEIPNKDTSLRGIIDMPKNYKVFKIIFKGREIYKEIDVPRDVSNVVCGIGYGAGIL